MGSEIEMGLAIGAGREVFVCFDAVLSRRIYIRSMDEYLKMAENKK